MSEAKMDELLAQVAAEASIDDEAKNAEAAKAADDEVKKAEAAAKAASLKTANDKLKLSGPLAIRPTATDRCVKVMKAGASAPVVEDVPFADTVVVPVEPVKPAVVAVHPDPVAHVAPPHSHADEKPIGTHDPKSANYWNKDKK